MARHVEVRKAESDGEHSMAATLLREYADSLDFTLDFQDFDDELRRFPGAYSSPRGCVLLGFVDAELAGCVAMRPLERTTCEMKRLFVRTGHRGDGLGRALALAIVRAANDTGYETMRLDTLASMVEANQLYASLGFEEIEPYYCNPLPGVLFFELRLRGRRSVELRDLMRSEIPLVWQIDRAETIDGIYHHEDGRLVLKPEHFDMKGWPPGEHEIYTPQLEACFDRGGAFRGAFEGDRLAGVVVMDTPFIGRDGNQLQMKFLHVDRAWRGTGLGRRLFEEGVRIARARGARKVYVSATPSRNTVGFYEHMGCAVTDDVDAGLFELEPLDIHMEYLIPE